MKKSLVALLIMVGLVGGMFIAGCGGGGEESEQKTITEKTGEQMEEAAKSMEESAETMKEEAKESAPQ